MAGRRLAREAEVRVLAVPPGPSADRFREQARQALPEVELAAVPGHEDVVFYREIPHLPLAELEQVGPAAREAYERMQAAQDMTPHCRTDLTDWADVAKS
jgi:hypothetical protein